MNDPLQHQAYQFGQPQKWRFVAAVEQAAYDAQAASRILQVGLEMADWTLN